MNEYSNCARAEPRTNMFVLAAISAPTASGPVKIRNLSPAGALIEGATLPRVGEQILLRRGDTSVSGKVIWSQSGKAGLQFDGRVDVVEWLPSGLGGQQRVDRTFQELKATKVEPRELQHSAVQSAHPEPDQLRAIAQAIEDLADDLASDAAIIARHCTKLQTLDIAAQALRKMAVAS